MNKNDILKTLNAGDKYLVSQPKTFDAKEYRKGLYQNPDVADGLIQTRIGMNRKYEYRKPFTQRLTDIIGKTIGSAGGVVGFLGDIADPIKAVERQVDFYKTLASKEGSYGRVAQDIADIGYSKELSKQMDKEDASREKLLDDSLRRLKAGEITKDEFNRLTSYTDTDRAIRKEAVDVAPDVKRTTKNIKDATIDTMKIVTDVAAASGTIKAAGGLAGIGKNVVNASALPKTDPGVILSKLGKTGQVLNTAKNAATSLVRNKAVQTIAPITRTIGDIAVKQGLTAKAAAGATGQNYDDTKILPDGALKTAAGMIWGAQVAFPYFKDVTKFAASNINKIKATAAFNDVSNAIDTDFAQAGIDLNRKIKVSDELGGGTITLKDALVSGTMRYGDEAGEQAKNINARTWNSFKQNEIARGSWTGDLKRDIENFELYLRKGTEQKPGRAADVIEKNLLKAQTKEQTGFVTQSGLKQLSDTEDKVGSFLSKDEVGMKFKKSGEISQAGTTFDITEKFTKPQVTKAQKRVAEALSEFRKTKAGKIFATKVETGALMKDIENNTIIRLKREFGDKGDKLYKNLNKVLDDYENGVIPVGSVKNLRDKAIKEALKMSKMSESSSRKLSKMLAESFDDTLRQNDIFSLKAKIGSKFPLFNQVDRAYMSSRFGLRPTFWAMQAPESTIMSGIARDEMTHPVSQKIFSKIFKQQEYGKNAKSFIAKVGGDDVINALDRIERPQVLSETVKRMKAQSAYFIQNYTDEIAKTPAGKELIKKYGSVDDIPFVKKFLTEVQASDEPAILIQKFIKDNSVPVGGKLSAKGNNIITGEDMLRKVATSKAAQKAASQSSFVQLYSGSRSPAERMLHNVLFPYSYSKKIVTKGGQYLMSGSALRPMVADKLIKGYSGVRDSIEDKAVSDPRFRPLVKLMGVFDPANTEFPLSPGGATPFFRAVDKMITNPRKYNLKTVDGANEVLKVLSPAYKEYKQYGGFIRNIQGKEETKDQKFFYPQYLKENRESSKGKLFRKYNE